MATAPIYVNGVLIGNAASQPIFTPVIRPYTAGDLMGGVQAAMAVVKSASDANVFFNDIARRAGAMPTAKDAKTPRPKIEIADLPDSGSAAAVTGNGTVFREFILTTIQEQDAEKAEITETFGAPHVFTSGRFMRRITISGVTRTAPVNYQAAAPGNGSQGVDLAVPQSLSLRVFYDQYLRASLMAKRRQFARLTIDSEVYCGWFTTYNAGRDAQNEQFATFTMSMVVFERYHVLEDRARNQYPAPAADKTKAWDDKMAGANQNAQAGTAKLTLNVTTASTSGTLSKLGDAPAFTSEVTLTVSDAVASVSVSSSIAGASLLIDGKTSPTVLEPGTYPVLLAWPDRSAFLAAISEAGDASSASSVTLQLSVTPTHGSGVSLSANVLVDSTPTKFRFQGVPQVWSTTSNTQPVFDSTTFSGNNLAVRIAYQLADAAGVTVSQDNLATLNPVLSCNPISGKPILNTGLGADVDTGLDAPLVITAVVASGAPSVINGYAVQNATLQFAPPGSVAYGAGGSPSIAAAMLSVSLTIGATIDGIEVANAGKVELQVKLPPPAIHDLFSQATMTYLGSEATSSGLFSSQKTVTFQINTGGRRASTDPSVDLAIAKAVLGASSLFYLPGSPTLGRQAYPLAAGTFLRVNPWPGGYFVTFKDLSSSALSLGLINGFFITLPAGYTGTLSVKVGSDIGAK